MAELEPRREPNGSHVIPAPRPFVQARGGDRLEYSLGSTEAQRPKSKEKETGRHLHCFLSADERARRNSLVGCSSN